ncbi:MAG: DNA/RNA non-specific endonuclease [Lachnospiraceae bacterium]|nr:DNA/RNA non-specific endonuclease [Lachnospiraceae bacterium]
MLELSRIKKYALLPLLLVIVIALTGCGNTNNVDLSSIPAYSGSPYVEINGNTPFFEDKEKSNTDAFEKYSRMDLLGRCGVAYANICKELMPTEERGEIGQIKPTGWHTVNYHELVDENYLYNRCHLIGFQLAGENANEKNLITGTRYMNVEGMLPFENKVADYVDRTSNHVLYRVTPVFDKRNLLASGVLMEAYSVEDNGSGVQFCVYCYNVQPGIEIDYATGDSKALDNAAEIIANIKNAQKETTANNKTANNDKIANNDKNANTDNADYDYVLNKKSKKFHKTDCHAVSEMSEKNKEYYSGSRQMLIDQGYEPCGDCKP